MDERFYWLGFSCFSGIGPVRFGKLLEYFGDAKAAWEASLDDLKGSGIGGIVSQNFVEFRRKFSISSYVDELRDAKVRFFAMRDLEYPRLLSQIKNPPIVLYVKGDLDFGLLDQHKTVGVVGTRKITTYGEQVTRLIVGDLVDAECVIVSGLAVGVDSCAHRETIERMGKTIAVLGSGVDLCTPSENINLYKKIIDSGGVIVSEFPLGQEPVKGSFPSRNRIIAGLSDAVLVTEGAIDSGALITAEDAFKNNRKVFAIPGPITSNYSRGPNSLIARGAIQVTAASDILRMLEIKAVRKRNKILSENKDEQTIIDLLQNENMHIDEVIKKINIPASKVGMMLSFMEMKGLVVNLGSGIFGIKEI